MLFLKDLIVIENRIKSSTILPLVKSGKTRMINITNFQLWQSDLYKQHNICTDKTIKLRSGNFPLSYLQLIYSKI